MKITFPHSLLFASLIMISLLSIAGCGADDEVPRAERPAATSTALETVVIGVATPSTPSPTIAVSATLPSEVDDGVSHLGGAGAELNLLSTEMQIALANIPVRDLRELALRLNPTHEEIPVVVQDAPPAYTVGDQESFWVHNLNSNSAFEITAKLAYMNDVAYAWVEVDQPYDEDAIIQSIDRFAEISYPAEVALFGSENNPGVDADPRLHVLHATGMGGGVAGYFSSADEYSRLANEFSNEKEMFYINLNWLNSSRDYTVYETVLAHEFQHMVHWYRDRNEETWLSEGLSEFAQEVAGFDPDTVFARTFADEPDTQLNTWRESSESNAEHYGSAYLFVSYLNQRFGPEFIQMLVAQPANGMIGIDAVLESAVLDLSAADVFGDWVIANYVDDPNALGGDGVYGYRHLAQDPPRLEATFDAYPVAVGPTTVNNYATDYYLFKGEGDVAVDFMGATTTKLAATAPYSGKYVWWSNRADDSDSRLTRRFDFSQAADDEPLAMDVTMWRDIEVDYDYGYVLTSRDGERWRTLTGQGTTTENPSGNSFGDGYTGISNDDPEGEEGDEAEWVTERFDLSDYTGEEIWLRFEYVTDDAVTKSGWFVDDIAIPAIDYATDFENGPDGWESEGWLLIDNELTQTWLLQVMEFDKNVLTDVRRIPVNEDGHATFAIEALGDGKTAALAVSALAPVTTEPAAYSFVAEPTE